MKTKTINHISKETADFILDNYVMLTMGLIVNEDFRNTFVEAVAIEIALDDMVEKRVADIRTEMGYQGIDKADCPVVNMDDYINYDDDEVESRINDSFQCVEAYNDAMAILIDELDDKAMEDIVFIDRNYMYLLRAFDLNPTFLDYVTTVVKNVKEDLSL